MKSHQSKALEQNVAVAAEAQAWEQRYRELELTCRLWIAAAEARDERVAELELECERLHKRVARLSRLANERQPQNAMRDVTVRRLRRTPTGIC